MKFKTYAILLAGLLVATGVGYSADPVPPSPANKPAPAKPAPAAAKKPAPAPAPKAAAAAPAAAAKKPAPAPAAKAAAAAPAAKPSTAFIGNTKSKILHSSTCAAVTKMKSDNMQGFNSVDDAKGYKLDKCIKK